MLQVKKRRGGKVKKAAVSLLVIAAASAVGLAVTGAMCAAAGHCFLTSLESQAAGV